ERRPDRALLEDRRGRQRQSGAGVDRGSPAVPQRRRSDRERQLRVQGLRQRRSGRSRRSLQGPDEPPVLPALAVPPPEYPEASGSVGVTPAELSRLTSTPRTHGAKAGVRLRSLTRWAPSCWSTTWPTRAAAALLRLVRTRAQPAARRAAT